MTVLGEAVVRIRADTAGLPAHVAQEGAKAGRTFSQAFNRSSKGAFTGVERELSQTTRGALAGSGAFTHLGRSLAFAGATFLGTAKAVDLFRQSIASAADEQKQLERGADLFKGSAGAVKQFADGAAKSLGLASGAALKFTNDIGQMLTPLKLTPAATAAVSVELTKLAGNLASIRHEDPSEVMAKLQAGLRGRGGALRAYGIILNDVALKEKALQLGLVQAAADPEKVARARHALADATLNLATAEKTYAGQGNTQQVFDAKEKLRLAQLALNKAVEGAVPGLSANQKQLASIAILEDAAAKHTLDFSKHSKDLANVQAVLHAEIENTKGAIGVALLPVVTKITTAMADWLGKSENQAKVQKIVTDSIKFMTKALNDLMAVVKFVSPAFQAISGVMGGFGNILKTIVAVKVGLWAKGVFDALAVTAKGWLGAGAAATTAAAEETAATRVILTDLAEIKAGLAGVATAAGVAMPTVVEQVKGVSTEAETAAGKVSRLRTGLGKIGSLGKIAVPISVITTVMNKDSSPWSAAIQAGVMGLFIGGPEVALAAAATTLTLKLVLDKTNIPGWLEKKLFGVETGPTPDLSPSVQTSIFKEKIPEPIPGASLAERRAAVTNLVRGYWTSGYTKIEIHDGMVSVGYSPKLIDAALAKVMSEAGSTQARAAYVASPAGQALAARRATIAKGASVASGAYPLAPGGFYISPVKAGTKTNRYDGGLDFQGKPGDLVVMIGDAVFNGVKDNPGGYGKMILYTLINGPKAGQQIFVGHASPLLGPGDVGKKFPQGTPIAVLLAKSLGNASNLSGWTEVGFAQGGHTLGSGAHPASGQAFAAFIGQKSFSTVTGRGVVPAPGNRTVGGVGEVTAAQIARVSAMTGLDPALIRRILAQESGGHQSATSSVGARGVMQLMAPSAASNQNTPAGLWANLVQGSKQFESYLNKYGDVRLALIAYNWGPNNLDKYLKAHGGKLVIADLPKETRGYLAKILSGYTGTGTRSDVIQGPDATDLHPGVIPKVPGAPDVIGLALQAKESAAKRAVTAAEPKGDSAIAKAIKAEEAVEDEIIRAAQAFLKKHPKMKKAVQAVIDAAKDTKTALAVQLDAMLSKKALSFLFDRPGGRTPEFVTGHPAGLLETGNIDIMNRPSVPTPGHPGMTSSVRTITIGQDKRFILIPTVIKVGGKWKVVSNAEAIAHYKKTGEHLGIFKSEAEADAYAEALHKQQANLVPDKGGKGDKGPGLQVQLNFAQTRVDRSADKGFDAQYTAITHLEDVDKRVIAAAKTALAHAKTAEAKKIIQDYIDQKKKDLRDLHTSLLSLEDANKKLLSDAIKAGNADSANMQKGITALLKLDPAMVVKMRDEFGNEVDMTVAEIIAKAKKLVRAWIVLSASAHPTAAQLAAAKQGIDNFFDTVKAATEQGASTAEQAAAANVTAFEAAFDRVRSHLMAAFDRETSDTLAAMQASAQAQIQAVQAAAAAQIASVQEAAQAQIDSLTKQADQRIQALQDHLQKAIKRLQAELKKEMDKLEREGKQLTIAEKRLAALQDQQTAASDAHGLADAQTAIAQARISGDPQAIKDAQRQLDDFLLAQQIAVTQKQAEASRTAEDESVKNRQEALQKQEEKQEESLTKQEAAAEKQIQEELAARIAAINKAAAAQEAAIQAEADAQAAAITAEEARKEREYQDQRDNERELLDDTLAGWEKRLATGKAKWSDFLAWLKSNTTAAKAAGGAQGQAFADGFLAALSAAGIPADAIPQSSSSSGSNAVGAGSSGHCFVAGTPIATPDGDRPIEELRVGDAVYTWDFERSQAVESKVAATFLHEHIETLVLHVEDFTVGTTPEHPFWTGRWQEAGTLTPGQKIASLHGQQGVIRLETGERADVYNIHVDHPDHNYFAHSLLVHNKTDPGGGGFLGGGEIPGPYTGRDDKWALVSGGETVIDTRLTTALKAAFLGPPVKSGRGDDSTLLVAILRELLKENKKHTDLLDRPITVKSKGRGADQIAFEASR